MTPDLSFTSVQTAGAHWLADAVHPFRIIIKCCIWNGQVETNAQSHWNRTAMLMDLYVPDRYRSMAMLADTGIAQWLERRTRDRKVAGSKPCTSGGGGGEGGQENFLLQGQLCVLTLISVSLPPPCYRRST